MIRNALRARGHAAWSCDLEDAEDGSPFHIKGDIFDVLNSDLKPEGVIVHPECTYLTSSGLHWNKRRPERAEKTEAALLVVERLLAYALERKEWIKFALENPHGCIGTRLPHLDSQFVKQTIQPHDYGEDASKATVLRLLNLPPLKGTKRVPGRIVEWPVGSGKMVERWSNQTDSGQNRLGPSDTRWMDRSRTYPRIGQAVADQWFGVNSYAFRTSTQQAIFCS